MEAAQENENWPENCIVSEINERIAFQQSYEREMLEFFASQSLSGHNVKKPWTTERVLEIVDIIKRYRMCALRQASDYYYTSKYDLIEEFGKDVLIFKRKLDDAPTIRIIPISEYFDVITQCHLALDHGGRDKMLNILKTKMHIPKKAIEIYIKLCKGCKSKRCRRENLKNSTRKSNIASDCNAQGQVDLIDFQSTPDGEFKWLMIYQNDATQCMHLRPLKSDSPEDVASELLKLFEKFGAPFTLQAEKEAHSSHIIQAIIPSWPECKTTDGGTRNPETQDRVENSKRDVELMLRSWMKCNNSGNWSVGCFIVQQNQNSAFRGKINRDRESRMSLQAPSLPSTVHSNTEPTSGGPEPKGEDDTVITITPDVFIKVTFEDGNAPGTDNSDTGPLNGAPTLENFEMQDVSGGKFIFPHAPRDVTISYEADGAALPLGDRSSRKRRHKSKQQRHLKSGDNVSDSAPKRPTCCCCLKACAGLPLWRAGGEGAALEVFIGLQYPPEVRPSLHICAECSAQLAAAAEFRRRAMAAYPILLHQKVIPETVIHEFDIEDDFEEDKPDVNELDSLMESETQNQSQEEEDIKPDVSQLGSLISASPAIEPEPEDIKPDISQLTVSPAHVSTLDHSYSDTPPTTTPQYMNTKTDVKSEHSCDAPLRTSQYIVIDSGVVHVLSSRASAAKNDELAPSAAEEAVEHASPPLSPSSSFDASSSVRPETDSGSPPTKVKKITQLIKENK